LVHECSARHAPPVAAGAIFASQRLGLGLAFAFATGGMAWLFALRRALPCLAVHLRGCAGETRACGTTACFTPADGVVCDFFTLGHSIRTV
jgi:hypothetical protein